MRLIFDFKKNLLSNRYFYVANPSAKGEILAN